MTWKLTKEISNLKSGSHHCKYEDGFTVHLRYDQTINKWFRDSDNIEENRYTEYEEPTYIQVSHNANDYCE